MPVTISSTKQYMAISPTMNDQWSGKILSSAERTQLEEPRRSSTQSRACSSRCALFRAAERSATVLTGSVPRPVPEARADRFDEIAQGDQVTVRADSQRQLR